MTREQKVAVAEAYLNGLGGRDFSGVPFAPDVTYESPLTPKLQGEEAIKFLEGLFPNVEKVVIKQHIVEGNYVATLFDFYTVSGTIPVFDRFRIQDGLLKEIHPFYDPTLLTQAS